MLLYLVLPLDYLDKVITEKYATIADFLHAKDALHHEPHKSSALFFVIFKQYLLMMYEYDITSKQFFFASPMGHR